MLILGASYSCYSFSAYVYVQISELSLGGFIVGYPFDRQRGAPDVCFNPVGYQFDLFSFTYFWCFVFPLLLGCAGEAFCWWPMQNRETWRCKIHILGWVFYIKGACLLLIVKCSLHCWIFLYGHRLEELMLGRSQFVLLTECRIASEAFGFTSSSC